MTQLNFGQNVSLHPCSFYSPKSEEEVLAILDANKGRRIRCIGRLHSWSNAVQCDDVLLDLRNLNAVDVCFDGDSSVARVGGGCQIKRLLAELEKQDLTLPSVGFITEQSVAGAISTGTHGSGRHSLSHYVKNVRVARYNRDNGNAVVDEIEGGDELLAARCSLGCVGVILSVTMVCRPRYRVEESFHEYDNLEGVLDAEHDYPLQQFYLVPWRWTYMAQHRREVDSRESRWSRLYRWYRFLVLDIAMHLLILLSVRVLRIHACTRGLFRWVLPAFVIRNCRCVADSTTQLVMEHEIFRHVEIELFVQRNHLDGALQFLRHTLCAAEAGTIQTDETFRLQLEQAKCEAALDQLRGKYCHHYPICVRRVLPDDTLISMASHEGVSRSPVPCVASDVPSAADWYSITLTNYHRGSDRRPFEELAKFLAKSMAHLFRARPHWGKLCPLSPSELWGLYPAMGRFGDVCAHADPAGAFHNPWIETLLGRQSE